MNEFISADLHLGHKNICKYTPHSPWKTTEEWTEGIIANWNNVVKKGDLVRIIGDYAFNNHAKYFHRLNGRKILVKGSHDKMSIEDLKACTETEIDRTFGWLRNFSEVYYKDLRFKFNGRFYYSVHTCPRVWETGHYGTPCLFAHSHGRLKTWNMSFDIGVATSLANFAPINMEVVEQECKCRYEMMDQVGRIVKEHGKTIFRQDDVAFMMKQNDTEINELED